MTASSDDNSTLPMTFVPALGETTSGSVAFFLAFLLQLVGRQEGYHALPALAVDDDLVSAAEHALHGLQIHALACHLGRLLVFVVDFKEARRLAGRLGDGLLLVGPGALQDTLGLTARLRNNLVGVGARLILQALLVGARGLHIA